MGDKDRIIEDPKTPEEKREQVRRLAKHPIWRARAFELMHEHFNYNIEWVKVADVIQEAYDQAIREEKNRDHSG